MSRQFAISAIAGTWLTAAALLAQPVLAQDAAEGGVLRVGISQMPPSPDPVVTTFSVNWATSRVVCESLFALDESWLPQPMLADSFEYNESEPAFRVTLRKDLTFHSGAPVTSADVVASLERFRGAAGIGSAFKALVEDIKAEGDDTIVLKLSAPSPTIPGLLAENQAVIMSKSSLEGASSTDATRGLDCTGPYRLVRYQPDEGAYMERWPNYQPRTEASSAASGKKHAHAKEITFKLMPEASVRRDSLITGEIDIAMELPSDFYAPLEEDPMTEPVVVPNYMSLTVVFNTKSGVASDVNLRRAIYYALDKSSIMMASVGSDRFYSLDPSWIPDPNSFWHTTAGVPDNYEKANVERAKEYLEKSDYSGEPIRWLVASEQYQKHYLTTLAASQQLEEIGINVEIVESPMASYIQTRADEKKMDAFASFLPTYVDPTSIAYLNASYPGFWSSKPKMDLMQKIATTMDAEERKEIMNEIHKLIYDEYPFIKFGTESNMYGVRKGLGNIPKTPARVGASDFYNIIPISPGH